MNYEHAQGPRFLQIVSIMKTIAVQRMHDVFLCVSCVNEADFMLRGSPVRLYILVKQ